MGLNHDFILNLDVHQPPQNVCKCKMSIITVFFPPNQIFIVHKKPTENHTCYNIYITCMIESELDLLPGREGGATFVTAAFWT